jgi:signal transduction histidine kinase/ligand-binding sensor domain-containing protein
MATILSTFARSLRTFGRGAPARNAAGSTGLAMTILGRAAAVLLTMRISAAPQDFQVRNWHVENGLPDSTVTSLAQTPDGYLWVGTRKGLARFDGDRFTRVETAGETALQDSSVTGLLTDGQGALWIAGESGLITRFAAGAFVARYRPEAAAPGGAGPAAKPSKLAAQGWHNPGSVFALDGAGAVWARTVLGEVIRFTGAGAPVAAPVKGLPDGNLLGLANDQAGRVWLLKGTYACVFEDGQWTFSKAARVPLAGKLLCPAGGGGFWTAEVSSLGAFAKRLQHGNGDVWNNSSLPIPTTPVHAPVSAMLEDRQGRLWLAVTWAGVYVKPRDGEWEHVQAIGPLAKSTATCLFEDQQGSIWAGSAGEGLNQVLEPSVQMELLPPEAADVHATTVCAARDGGLWVGTDKGLYCRAPGMALRLSAVEGLGGESIYAVMEDTRTNLWVATRSGLFKRESAGFKRSLTLPVYLGGIVALCEDRAGNIWAGGPHGSLFCLRAGASEAAFEPMTAPTSLDICGQTEDARGQIWVATMLAGLWRLDGKQLVRAGKPLDAFSPNPRALLCGQDGALWIGTWGDGLFRWQNQTLQHYTTDDGLPDDVILGLMPDDQGNLWMTSHNGIFGCSCRQLAEYKRGQSAPLLCRHLGPDEGLANRECTGAGQPVISRAPDGRFWAATMVGAAAFAPGRLARSTTAAEVRLEALRVDGRLLRPGSQAFRVPASSRHFEFQYSAPELAAPKTLRFRYRLDGLDQNWVEAGPGRLASYSRLLPGQYHFRVMAGGEDGLWREARSPVTLIVVPQFWQTKWFQALVFAATVIALAGGVALNERRKARRRLERLEAQQAVEQMRQRIARDLHDELGSAITEIIQLGDLTLQREPVPETLQPSVKSMTGRLRQLGVTLDEIVWTMSSRNDTLPNVAGYISNHAQEFFRHSGMLCRLDVTKNLPGLVVHSQTRHNLFLAVKEALNNAAKHSGAREVLLRVHYADRRLQVSIEDNGRGFDAAADPKGHGLSNMRERLRAVQGRAEFFSRPGGGARVVFTLDLTDSPAGPAGGNPQ